MGLQVNRDYSFTLSFESDQLSKGLRPSKRMPRNSGFLTELKGGVGRDGVLQILDALIRIDTSAITDAFPYPQIFTCINVILVCGKTKIYEWSGSLSAAQITVTAGSLWRCVDFYDYIYLTNGKVAVVRDAGTKTYSLSSTLPHGVSVCNFNGQVILGAPDVDWT